MQENAEKFIGDVPTHYDAGLGPVIFAGFAAEMAARAAALAPATVLETAAGTGIVSQALRAALPSSDLTVTDLNAPMLDIARKRLGDGVRVEVADAQALDYDNASFDVVVCQFGIMFFPDRPAAFREARRVLRPGGRYLFSVWGPHADNPFGRIADDLVRSLFPDDPPGFYRIPFSCAEIDPLVKQTVDAGFDDAHVDVLTRMAFVADWAAFATGLVYGNPLIGQIHARATVGAEEVHARLVDALERELGPAPARMPVQTIFYSALA